MKEQIQQLIANGQTKEALQLLVQINGDALLLQAQYNNGEKQFNLGLIEFSEWQRIQARVNFAALEMVGKATVSPAPSPEPPPVIASPYAGKDVFISYSHIDGSTADSVVTYLKNKGIQPAIDNEILKPGENIEDFATRCIRENPYVLFLVSEQSLLSGWVGFEVLTSSFAKKLIGTQILPAALDDTWNDTSKITTLYEKLDLQIKELEKERKKRIKFNAPTSDIESKLKRLRYLFDNLSDFSNYLSGVLTVSLAEPNFQKGMDRLISVIKG